MCSLASVLRGVSNRPVKKLKKLRPDRVNHTNTLLHTKSFAHSINSRFWLGSTGDAYKVPPGSPINGGLTAAVDKSYANNTGTGSKVFKCDYFIELVTRGTEVGVITPKPVVVREVQLLL